MKRVIILTIIAAMLLPLFSFMTACDKKDTSFRVMTFNIRCIAFEPVDQNNWSNRSDIVLETIRKYAPDLIGFQEPKLPQLEFLKDNLTDYGWYGLDRTGTPFGETPAIFYKKDRFEVISTETFWLSETPDVVSIGWDSGVLRNVTVIKLKDLISGKELTQYNTHFDNQGTISEMESVNLLLEKMGDKNGLIATGDFNLPEGGDSYKALIAKNLKDTKYLAPEGCSDSGGTTQNFGTTSAENPIDFILVTDAYFKVSNYKVVRDTYDGYYPSDHYPLIADLDYND
jgi:endonuclease/exonuclease/phosphatase family metal-dependent hydrolase